MMQNRIFNSNKKGSIQSVEYYMRTLTAARNRFKRGDYQQENASTDKKGNYIGPVELLFIPS